MIKPLIRSTNSKPLNQEEIEQLKFSLYLKNRKITEISKIMSQVILWPKKNRDSWAKKFSPEISDLLDDLLDDAVAVFDGTALNNELMELFVEFTNNLKTVTRQVQGVIIINKPITA